MGVKTVLGFFVYFLHMHAVCNGHCVYESSLKHFLQQVSTPVRLASCPIDVTFAQNSGVFLIHFSVVSILLWSSVLNFVLTDML